MKKVVAASEEDFFFLFSQELSEMKTEPKYQRWIGEKKNKKNKTKNNYSGFMLGKPSAVC